MRHLLICFFCSYTVFLSAFNFDSERISSKQEKALAYKMNCAQATAQTELDINNVRARLLVGGDFGWDGNRGRYIVPKVEPGGPPEVSSLFAGAIWLGGVDALSNLRLAAQQYGTGTGSSDYWPGPLTSIGQTQAETCANWDRFFSVTSADIDLHLAQYEQAQQDNMDYDIDLLPISIKEWPAIGNQFFFEQSGFNLPSAEQGLAPFWDENGDGIYTPQYGDYPIIEIRGCNSPHYADEMKFWIFNDAGNIHTESNAAALQMEIQAQSFAYVSDDAINDMTFSRYKLINRAAESIFDTYFGIWLDPDLGCGEDDFVGCDTTRNMMYVYNSDAVDGSSGANCIGGVNTYGDKIPYLGVDYFRGPLAPKVFTADGELVDPEIGQFPDTLVEQGMSSFMYFNRVNSTTSPAQTDPTTPIEYYNYLCGTWKDGTPLTVGGSGLGASTIQTKFALYDEPNNENGWSMCTANLPQEDRRTIQSAGPFRLDPGQINELIIGIPWVPDVEYPCPDMSRLYQADDLAQDLFDNCFEVSNTVSTAEVNHEKLNQIEVFPNPAMASSNAGDLVNITNLPLESTVTIYTLAGNLVRQFELESQDATLQWDLRSAAGLPVPSGLYFIHIHSEEVGERVLKLSVLN